MAQQKAGSWKVKVAERQIQGAGSGGVQPRIDMSANPPLF